MTGHGIDDGLAFEVGDLWRPSSLAVGPKEESTLFPSLDFALPDLTDGSEQHEPLIAAICLELLETDEDDIKAPALEDLEAPSLTLSEDRGSSSAEKVSDIWSLDLDAKDTATAPLLRTWEAFEKKTVGNAEQCTSLSESKPEVFDAAISASGVLPRDVTLRALCNLALGRSSVFFQWDSGKKCFRQTLFDVAISGLSQACTASVILRMMEYGSIYRALTEWSESATACEPSNSATKALKQAVARILRVIESSISWKLPKIASLMQLQDAIEDPIHLLSHINEMRGSVEGISTEVLAISEISDRVLAIVESDSYFSGAFKMLLAQVCAPWLATLRAETGLTARSALSTTDQSGEAPPEDEQENLSMTEDVTLEQAAISLLTPEDEVLIKDTKASLKLLRQHFPDHEMVTADHDIDQSAIDTLYTVSSPDVGAKVSSLNNEAIQGEEFDKMNARMNLAPGGVSDTAEDALQTATKTALHAGGDSAEFDYLSMDGGIALNPFEDLRSQLQAQSHYLNSILIRHLFRSCGLRRHLDLQRMFQLLGHGDFVTRLSTALFSPETQSARRTRGVVPTGEVLGLRLGAQEGQRWPPASSELRLTLNGVLHEALHSDNAHAASSVGRQADLPGGLSFAIRELPDEEIDRVMDASSIYALDFLKLQYTAPPPLDAILTPKSMQGYDDIFKFLLRLLRVLDATTRVRGRAPRFAFSAHHFVTSLVSCLMDVGISSPWKQFLATLDAVEKALAHDDDALKQHAKAEASIASLQYLHESCLDVIRGRLFLKRKQARVREMITNVLVAILDGVSAPQSDGRVAAFEERVRELLKVLQSIVDKPPRQGQTENEIDMARLLLAGLNFNEYYNP